jgi:predicted restriction endonuclease
MTFRIIRETALVRHLKKLHHHEGQLCARTINLADGERYSEGHHIRPLGGPHRGPDIASNIIVVCPTCHVLLDYFAIPLDGTAISGGGRHQIGPEFLAYHNVRYEEAARATKPVT